MGRVIDLTGQRFGRLTVFERDCLTVKSSAYWICICDCGEYVSVNSQSLRRGKTCSCGCFHKEMQNTYGMRHGKSNTRLYGIWHGMKDRCYNSNNPRYSHYGGKGVAVCDEWKNDFQAFYDWAMANGYSDDLSIDRIDVNGNYEPSNCRWADKKTQANNTSKNHIVTAFGETKTLAQWAETTGINAITINTRLRNGWSPEEALKKKKPL